MSNTGILFLACCCFCCNFLVAAAQPPAFLALKGSITWDGTGNKYILQTESSNPSFACGFDGRITNYFFAIFIFADGSASDPRVVWTANRGRPLNGSSALQRARDGYLQLVDGFGRIFWSAGRAGKPVTAMRLEQSGNLVLLDAENVTVWQSFDHPTDTLVAEQQLRKDQRLTSSSNSTEASYFVSTKDGDWSAFVEGEPPQVYLQLKGFNKTVIQCGNDDTSITRDCKGTETAFLIRFSPSGELINYFVTRSANHFLKLVNNGELMVHDWNSSRKEWVSSHLIRDAQAAGGDKCLAPLACGPFGVCLRDGRCTCPTPPDGKLPYFKPLDDRNPSEGCKEILPAPSCNERDTGSLVDFGNYSYFRSADPSVGTQIITTLSGCCHACLSNYSCKAVFFIHKNEDATGTCHVLYGDFSMGPPPWSDNESYSPQRAFFKVSCPSQQNGQHKNVVPIVGIAVGSLVLAIFVVLTVVFLVIRKKGELDEEEDELDQMTGMVPRRFSYEELRTATRNFQTVLGRGGFGSVYEGVLNDGTHIAVKRLDNKGQGMKEFVAEVQTIGSIHHMNLVRLVGFCASKSHRLLIYEYMPNGSLDKWIFHENDSPILDWKTRMNIISDTAKGLCYLHDECSPRIAHLDIKPQNILLDGNFNAKLSDFGLSKLISRDESQVMTTMRGTPGYLAPEWLSASISEKADVYSFGVVIMEVVCGRKNLDPSQPEGRRLLMELLESAQENQVLLDLVDMTDEERSCYAEEAERVMRIAMWCLQNDYTSRPSMPMAVKALEGTMEPDAHIEFGTFHAMAPQSALQMQSGSKMLSEAQSYMLPGPR